MYPKKELTLPKTIVETEECYKYSYQNKRINKNVKELERYRSYNKCQPLQILIFIIRTVLFKHYTFFIYE